MEKKNPNVYQRALNIVNSRINPDISQGGGSSVPKPLTYDYMPEGYPSKTMGHITLMEEQEVNNFADAGDGKTYAAAPPVEFELTEGETYIVNWDGTEYSCVCHTINNAVYYIGNPAAFDVDATIEPFLYAVVVQNSQCLWAAYDASASHTIGVTEVSAIYNKIDSDFLPDNAFTDAEWGSISNRPMYISPMQKALNAESKNCSIQPGSTHSSDRVNYEIEFTPGCTYQITGEIIVREKGAYTIPIDGLYSVESNGSLTLGSYYSEYYKYIVNIYLYGCNSKFYTGLLGFSSGLAPGSGASENHYSVDVEINITFINEIKQLDDILIPDTIQRVEGDVIIPSSTSGSTKKFKITVDDSGAISATEVS